jgi:hypothetical protein
MAHLASMTVGRMQAGDEGFCSKDALYVAPRPPRGPGDDPSVADVSPFLLPDSSVCGEPSARAKVPIRRLEAGFAICLPPGEVPSSYRREHPPDSCPVVVIERAAGQPGA